MARSYKNSPSRFSGLASRKEFKTNASGKLRARSKELLNRLAKKNNLESFVAPKIREVSNVAEVLDYGCWFCACHLKYGDKLHDAKTNPKILRK